MKKEAILWSYSILNQSHFKIDQLLIEYYLALPVKITSEGGFGKSSETRGEESVHREGLS